MEEVVKNRGWEVGLAIGVIFMDSKTNGVELAFRQPEESVFSGADLLRSCKYRI